MANIRENKKNGKTISYRFTACLERDENGKQIRRYCTWKIPEGLSPSKARKAAERAADKWEQDVKAEYELEQELIQTGKEHTMLLQYSIATEASNTHLSRFLRNYLRRT